jgi:pimeloyl-ACP methyl ester carboxylesterase
MLRRQRCTSLGMNWFALIALFFTPLLSGCVFRELNEQQEERLRSHDAQITARFAAVTAAGVVTTLSDPRFRAENVRAGMRDPYDFILNVGPGVYFLEKYDPSRIPVLFVHGIDGSPDNFRYLIERLDRQRFQAWVYYYPSGARLGLVADHLAQTVLQIERHYRVTTLVLVAHSMGGLVARGFLLRHEPDRLHIPLFISLSTPWSGHSAAQIGLDLSPAAIRSWHDIAPASDYLQSLFYTQAAVRRSLPERTQHQLLFSFKKGSGSFGESSDQVVTVASELRAEAQDDAAGVYGFDDTHMGILEDPQVSLRVNKLLDAASPASLAAQ